jgi:dethiobiotin synthetase
LSVWGDRCEIVLVEGAGGLLSPVGPNVDVADLARQFGYPLVVVAPNRLGAINQTLQTLLAARSIPDGPPVAGVVLNHVAPTDDPSAATNRRELERRGSAPILGEVFWQADRMDLEVDWISLADAKKADF